MPLVSVLMPCYNAAATLDGALESLTRQSLKDLEIVAVDDGSADGTRQILDRWQKRDARLRVVTQPHRGIVCALQTGLGACCAPVVARMDADDLCHPERLERQLRALELHPEVALVSCRVSGFPEENVRGGFAVYMDWQNGLLEDAEIRREIFIESPFPHPSVTIRKEAVEAVGGYQERGWAEDYDLWLRLYLAGARFMKLPQVLLEWREHPERLTRTDSRYSLENFLRLKAYYLARGPLLGHEALILWGAGMMGRRLAKQLERQGCQPVAFVDIDPKKIGRTKRGAPIISPEDLPSWLERWRAPVVLAAVGSRGARVLIRRRLNSLGLVEGADWWAVA